MKKFNPFTVAPRLAYALLFSALAVAPNQAGAQKKTNAVPPIGYGTASYPATAAGKFMRSWLLAGPVLIRDAAAPEPDAVTQEKFFNESLLERVAVNAKQPIAALTVKNRTLSWKAHNSNTDAIDLDAIFNKPDFCQAFALAEINSDREQSVVLAFGSDDGIKVYLNGKLVHKNWIPRGVTPDDDAVPVTLQKGSNQLLLAIQDVNQGWGFTARILDKQGLSDRLAGAAARGDLDEAGALIKAGAALDQLGRDGLTPLSAARIAGREEMAALLLKSGANDTPVPSPSALIDGL